MKKHLFNKKHAISCRKSLLLFASVCLTLAVTAAKGQTGSTKICSASDLHYFNPSLLINDGVAFQTYLAQDRKLIAESKAITEALVHKIYEEKPELLLVTGDLTKDGEKLSHQDMAKYLDSIEMNGVTKVFVIPGNHDVNNVDAYSYDGANKTKVDYISPSDFKSIYQNFGYAEATKTDSASLSYLAKPKSNLWVLGIDVCEYDLNFIQNQPVTAGRFKPETYKWVLDRLAEAKAAGATVIGMMHHGLTEHYTGQSISFPEYLVAGWDTISKNLADAGLKIVFTGHYHANDITKKNGTGSNFVYDIETGSTVTWPCPYRVMNLSSGNIFNITTKTIDNVHYNTNGLSFQDYAKQYLNTGMTGIVKYVLMQAPYSLDAATASALTPHVVAAYAAHYAGDEKMPATEKGFIDYLAANGQEMFAGMLTSLWTDLYPADNNIVLNLNPIPVQNAQTLQFIYTSDAHYGITRARFQHASNVNATVVNGVMIDKMNNMQSLVLPKDGGVNEGKTVGAIDYVIMTGDIANRQEVPIQSATKSWTQFKTDYIDNLFLQNKNGDKSKLLLLPGNHDVSDAIGFYKTMVPKTDSASMVNIYNMMMPSPRPDGKYNYTNEKIHYSKNVGGVHMMFVCMWPDSAERIWMETDLAGVSSTTPVLIFTHDQPDIETKHLTNPNGTHNINSTDKFENMVSEVCKDGKTVSASSSIEQRGFASFVKKHPNVVVYFHGNSNSNEYYTYKGPDNNIILNTIRVDSPMKGNISATDETKLSFQLISVDTVAKSLTVRECLWNSDTLNFASPIVFGASKTITLNVAQNLIMFANTLVETDYTIPTWTLLKRAITLASKTGDSASIASLSNAIKSLQSKTQPYSVSVDINGNPSTQMGFAWFTNVGVSGGKVKIVAGNVADTSAFTSPLFTVNATSDSIKNLNYNVAANGLLALAGIADNSKRSYMSNKALVNGLAPNTTYSYIVGKPGAWSKVGSFTTAKASKEAFSFVYTTDPQAQTDAMFDVSQKTTHSANAKYPNANFWLSCGDLIESSGNPNSEWEYEQFFATQQDIWSNKPFAAMEGNHDKSTNKNFTNHFNTANPSFDKTMATTPGAVYSFVYGDALFMALSYEDYSVPGYLDSLANWMTREVAAHPELKWRVAFYHKTMYTGSGSHQSDADGKAVREKMGPVFDKLKIDLALQGHDHIYEVMGPIKANKLVANAVSNQTIVPRTVRDNVSGRLGGTFDVTNGTLYFLNNSAGKKKYEPRDSVAMSKVEVALNVPNYFGMFTGRFGQTGEPTFSNISVSTDSINISTYTVSDAGVSTIFDAFKVVKTVHVDTVLLADKTVGMTLGSTYSMDAKVMPVTSTNKNVSWSSSDSNIATVSASGVITAINVGQVTITVTTADGGKTASSVVTIVPDGKVFCEFWNNIDGAAVKYIPVKKPADSISVITSLEKPISTGYTYGMRVRGYIIPSKTAKYTLYIASDDNGELWLSSNDMPENKALIANVPGWTFQEEWNKYSKQKSASINLLAGKKYYFEALMKQRSGNDNLSIGWTTTKGINDIEIIGSANISSYIMPEAVAEIAQLKSATLENGSVQVDDKLNSLQVKVYPNPVVGNTLHISFTGYSENELIQLNIFNISGIMVYSQSLTNFGTEQTIDISLLPKGIYLLKLNSNNDSKTIKIVKE